MLHCRELLNLTSLAGRLRTLSELLEDLIAVISALVLLRLPRRVTCLARIASNSECQIDEVVGPRPYLTRNWGRVIDSC